MIQPGLDFTPPRARRSDPETSQSAAKRTAPKAGELRRAVLGALWAHPEGITAAEIAIKIGVRDGSVTPRMPELEKFGLARTTGASRDGSRIWQAC
jgi:hypothetical protein